MKVIFHSLFALFFASTLQAHAGGDGGVYDHGNGGDECELAFKNVRDNLHSWIVKGWAKELRLPSGLTHDEYNRTMIHKMSTAKVSCTDKQLFVGSAEKTCKNFIEAGGTPSIQCNKNRFMATSTPNQYILIHHEYAGLAGFEVNNGEDSNYLISNQMIRTLAGARLQTVKSTMEFIAKVTVRSINSPDEGPTLSNAICMYIGRVNQGDVIQELYQDLVSIDGNVSNDLLPDSSKIFSKLRINIMGLMNYCIKGLVKEDPQPISPGNPQALQARITEIQQQISMIENYLDKRFPNNSAIPHSR